MRPRSHGINSRFRVCARVFIASLTLAATSRTHLFHTPLSDVGATFLRPADSFVASGLMLRKGGKNAAGKLAGAKGLAFTKPSIPPSCRMLSHLAMGIAGPGCGRRTSSLAMHMPAKISMATIRPNICSTPKLQGLQVQSIWEELLTLGLKGGAPKAHQEGRGGAQQGRGGLRGRGRGNRGGAAPAPQQQAIILDEDE
jgi:hypothetical protein